MPFVLHGAAKTTVAMTQRQSAFLIIKSYLFHRKNVFWYKPTHSCSLIGCCNAIYLTLEMYRPEHWLIPSSLVIMCMIVSFHAFCPYVLSEKKMFYDSFT